MKTETTKNESFPNIPTFYTDGACSGNPGPGGWAFLFFDNMKIIHEGSGFAPLTTNNQMELTAILSALKYCSIFLDNFSVKKAYFYSDSQYCLKGIQLWMSNWIQRDWKTSEGKKVLNQNLWQSINDEISFLKKNNLELHWHYVKGHSKNYFNDWVDRLARSQIP